MIRLRTIEGRRRYMNNKLAGLKGYLRDIEGEKLMELASFIPKEQAIVEIGSYMGKSTCYLASGSNGSMVYAIDLWDLGDYKERYKKPETFKTFKKQISDMDLTQKITVIKGNSIEIAKTWDQPVGLLFIDANHEFEFVKADYEAWHNFVVPGGYIAFHDYKNPDYPSVVGASKFIDEVIKHSILWNFEGLYHSLYVMRRKTDNED